MNPRNLHCAIFLLVGIVLTSCATYYQQHHDFNSEFEKGDLGKALEVLQQKESLANSKTPLIPGAFGTPTNPEYTVSTFKASENQSRVHGLVYGSL